MPDIEQIPGVRLTADSFVSFETGNLIELDAVTLLRESSFRSDLSISLPVFVSVSIFSARLVTVETFPSISTDSEFIFGAINSFAGFTLTVTESEVTVEESVPTLSTVRESLPLSEFETDFIWTVAESEVVAVAHS
jgi:hypothetical protein